LKILRSCPALGIEEKEIQKTGEKRVKYKIISWKETIMGVIVRPQKNSPPPVQRERWYQIARS
jgi:hypothetical protein